VIVVVAVVIMLVSLAAYGFLSLMETEHRAALARGKQMRTAAVAASGREYLAAVLEMPLAKRPVPDAGSVGSSAYGGLLVDGDVDRRDDDEPRGFCAIVAPRTGETGGEGWRFGYEDESSKLHLGTLLEWDRRVPGSAAAALLNLPGMDESTADAILDWIDADNTPRDQGAEEDYYKELDPPQSPRNGLPSTLQELLLVRGVTRGKLFGRDVDASFRIEAWEEDLTSDMSGVSGVSGVSSYPWSHYLTLYSAERDETYEGKPRILINQPDLGTLQRELSLVLDAAAANFIVVYRQYGPASATTEGTSAESVAVDLSVPPQRMIGSLVELIGVSVSVPTSDPQKPQIVTSPFVDDPGQMQDYLPRLMDAVTTRSGAPIGGRVNINRAEREVLEGVPGVDASLAERIVSARSLSSGTDQRQQTTGWLLSEGLVNRDQFRAVEPWLTTRGDVGSAQILGYYGPRWPVVRFETVLDGTERPARQLYYRDLRRLGPGIVNDLIRDDLIDATESQ
jgi:type II secretory pathway component PulK